MNYPVLNKLVMFALLLSGSSFGAETIRENAGMNSFQLLELPVNARLIAMGSAGAAMAEQGFASYNPAAPFLIGTPYAYCEYGVQPASDLRRGFFETAWQAKTFFIGAGITTASILDIYSSTLQGINYNNPGSAQLTAIAVTGGFHLGSHAAMALCVNGAQDRIFNDAAYALSASLGAVWQPLPGKLTIGLAALHLGGSTSYLDTIEHLGSGGLPISGRLGIAWQDRFKGIDYCGALDCIYRKTDGRIEVPVGIEVWPLHALALRLGKRFNNDAELLDFGVGLRIEPITVDVAFALPRYVDDVQPLYTVGLGYTLRSRLGEKRKTTVIKPPPVIVTPLAEPAADSLNSKQVDTAGIREIVIDTLPQTIEVAPATIDSVKTVLPAIDLNQALPQSGAAPVAQQDTTAKTDTVSPPQPSIALPDTAAPAGKIPAADSITEPPSGNNSLTK
jgi:hypothetical protein